MQVCLNRYSKAHDEKTELHLTNLLESCNRMFHAFKANRFLRDITLYKGCSSWYYINFFLKVVCVPLRKHQLAMDAAYQNVC